jgi:predicted phosphodiesterase
MKYALITDLHGNLEATEAVLGVIDGRYPDAEVLCLGDIVGYGPDPAACVDLMRDRGIPCVRGNHDEMVVGARGFSRCIASAISAAIWSRRQLDDSQMRFLRDLPIRRSVSTELAMCHGDLDSADTYVSDGVAANRALQQLEAFAPGTSLLVCGHTHHAATYSADEGFVPQPRPATVALHPDRRWVINPGAVGQSRDGSPLAQFAVIDTDRRQVVFEHTAYDHPATEAKMRRAGLTAGVVLNRPSGIGRHVERLRTRWVRHWADRANRRLGT